MLTEHLYKFKSMGNSNTVNFLNIQTPKTFVVITLKFEPYGSTIELQVQTMQTEWQMV